MLTGIDVLARDGFAPLQGRKVGLITNHTGRAADGTPTIDLLHKAPGVHAGGALQPRARHPRRPRQENVPSTRDEATGLPIHSLYGETRRPTDAMLQGIDTLVLDLQDVGVRFYTYAATMGYVLEEAAKRKIRGRRPRPAEPDRRLADRRPAARRRPAQLHRLHADADPPRPDARRAGACSSTPSARSAPTLTVVELEGWRRDQWFDHTGLAWVNPSPNMRNLNQATLYPGIGAIEYANLSVGRGTDQPFEQIGAPWIDGRGWPRR